MHPALGHLPVGDSTLDARDRQISVWVYAALGGAVAVSQQAILNYETLKGIAQQGTLNYEVRGQIFVAQQATLNFEVLRGLRSQGSLNYEWLTLIRSQATLNYEARSVVVHIQQIHEI